MSDRRRDEEPGLVRAYRFVPLPDGPVKTERPPGHHRYGPGRVSGRLQATLTAFAPVHVGSGLLEPASGKYPLIKAHFRSGGQPTLPGSSLKGCVRAVAEALSASYVQVTRSREIDPGLLPPRSRDNPERLDIVQRIFGAFGYQGAVNFGDAPAEGEMRTEIVPAPPLYAPRTQAYSAYFEGSRPRGRKFYPHNDLIRGDTPLEACPEGTRFALRVDFSNLEPAELGLLLVALGLSGEPGHRFRLKIGGGKPAGLGTIEVGEPQLELSEGLAAYTSADFAAPTHPAEPGPYIAAAYQQITVLAQQLDRLMGAIDE